MGGGTEEEAVGKLLRPLTNNNRLRHLSITESQPVFLFAVPNVSIALHRYV